jgi:hypothetical protein
MLFCILLPQYSNNSDSSIEVEGFTIKLNIIITNINEAINQPNNTYLLVNQPFTKLCKKIMNTIEKIIIGSNKPEWIDMIEIDNK